MLVFDTIVACATPLARSALAVIRMSGDESFEIIKKVIHKKNLTIKGNESIFLKIYDEDDLVDETITSFFVAPNSFTGFNTVEITCHGSLITIERIIDLLIKNGARRALKGEFSYQAYMNNKIDLLKAESINDLINSNSIQANKIALLAMKGDASKFLDEIKEEILKDISSFEYYVEDSYFDDEEEIEKTVEEVLSSLEKIHLRLSDTLHDIKVKNRKYSGYRVALVGKSNVGKSTLLNALIKEDKAIVSSIPGTTRDIIEADIEINGIKVTLIDTAGIRKSDDVIENIGIKKTISEIDKADLILHIFDDEDSEKEFTSLLEGKNVIRVLSKADLNKKVNSFDISVSALFSSLDDLKEMIKTKLDFQDDKEVLFLGKREEDYIALLKDEVEEAIDVINNTRVLDISSDKMRRIIDTINEMKGLDKSSTMEDIYETLFSSFCLGK
ncbi:MAG: tRNA uridine-5-carboxymethylaminomethyl(34) synthesis GTPase MnmE [Candidatus Enterosoma sp.]|nr:tRNA uridine-5-carboxymethylaminomethyl(34) synthesis GTPase MnmE [Candidatus Enterosoma sp.]